MKTRPNILELDGVVAPIGTNYDGFPMIASLSGWGYGYCGEYLTGDGRVCNPTRQGGNYRDIKETDRIFDNTGRLAPAKEFAL